MVASATRARQQLALYGGALQPGQVIEHGVDDPLLVIGTKPEQYPALVTHARAVAAHLVDQTFLMDAGDGRRATNEEHRGLACGASGFEVTGLAQAGEHFSPADAAGLQPLLVLAAGILAAIGSALLGDALALGAL